MQRQRLCACALALVVAATAGTPGTVSAKDKGLQQAVLRVEQGKVQLSLRGGFATPRYRVSLSDDRRQLRVDLPGMTLGKRGLRVQGKAGLVHKSRIRRLRRGLRLTLALRQPVTYRARGQAGHIALWLEAVPATALTAKTQQANRAGAQVRALRLQRREERERIVIEIDAHTDYQVEAGTGGQRILRLRHCRLPQKVARQAARLRGDVVGPVQVEQRGTQTLITVTPEAGARATALRRGKRIVWIFAPPQGPSARPRSVTVARERWGGREEGEAPSTEVAGFHTALPLQIGGARRPRRYRGRRIDLDFKDADIHNILRLIAEVGQVNVVTSDDVAGMVTIRMRGVPWDEALAVILQAKGLGMVRRGNMIRVAPLTALEKEREAEIARAKQQEQLAPLETRLVPVSYATAEELQPRVRELLSSRGSVSVDVRTNMLVVRDITDNLSDVEALVRTLDTQTPQVLIEARIVEASSQYARDVGIQWGGDATMSTATGNPTGLNFPANVGIAGGNFDAQTPTQGLSPFSGAVNPSNFAVNLPAITGTGQGGALGMTFGSLDGNFNLNVRLSAAESNGIIRIISSPRILTLDNNEANIGQGTLIPFSQVSAQGVQTAFQEAKLELRVRPHVTSDGAIAMHVKVTRDEPDFTRTGPRGDPTILKREAETDLLVPDGNTAVIGGIYTRNSGRNVDQVPFFGDIPILGVLFRRKRVRDERNELLIFLTPRIVNRSAALRM